LHAFLGDRQCGQACQRPASCARSDEFKKVDKRTAMKSYFFLAGAGLLLLSTALLFAYKSQHSLSNGHASDPAPQLLKQVGSIELPGPKGKRFDYLTIDSSRHLLFSTHLGAGLLYAIDLKTGKVVKTFEDLPGIEGVELAPDVNKAYTSNWQENKIGVIDLQ